MKIAVVNTVLSNTGDAAIYASIVQTLVDAGATTPEEITALDNAAHTTAPLYPDWRVAQQLSRSASSSRLRRRAGNALRRLAIKSVTAFPSLRRASTLPLLRRTSFSRTLRVMEQADVIVSSGGTYLVDHYRFAHRVDEILLAEALGKPVVLWTQSMGPFATKYARKHLRRAAGKVSAAYFRDQRSRAAWERVAPLPEIAEVLPDTVFSMMATPQSADPGGVKTALISVRPWSSGVAGGTLDNARYYLGMRTLAEELLADGWHCVALSTCQGVPGYAVDDSATAKEIFKGTAVQVDTAFHTPAELSRIIATADLVVSTRMHFAILSLIAGTPVTAIAYETKSIDLFSGLGQPDHVVPIEDVDAEWARRVAESKNGAVLDVAQRAELKEQSSRPRAAVLKPA